VVKETMVNYRILVTAIVLIALIAALGFSRLTIDTDVVRSLPTDEKVIADGLHIFEHHPIHDQIAVDVAINRDDPDILVACGEWLEEKMEGSGLFARVGAAEGGERMAPLALEVAGNLPLLFSEQDLRDIRPLLEPGRINDRIRTLYEEMGSLQGIGQARFASLDPLGLKDRILGRMVLMAPSMNVRMYRNQLLSEDGRHLLITARPLAGATDTAGARRISDLFATAARELTALYAPQSIEVTLTPVGAYRAALDNERIIRHDVQLALVLSTLGIAVLLLLSFSRPMIGLLCLVPAVAGAAAALFAYSLFRDSISIMVLGFGGAVISITVDHGIAYLLFLDGPEESGGREASRELRAVGLMAVVTTIVAFLILSCSGFPIFTELGLFTGLGMLFSLVFVHTVFPKILPVMPPGSGRPRPLQKLVNLLYTTGRPGAVSAAMLAVALLFFARPQFHVSLSSMNTVSQATEQADALFTRVWGKIDDRIYLMHTAETTLALQRQNDLILDRIEQDEGREILSGSFVPSMLFPGPERSARNLAAWQAFWNGERTQRVKTALGRAGETFGFTPDAFAPFLSLLGNGTTASSTEIQKEDYGLLGISENDRSGLIQFITLVPGNNYDPADFTARYGKESSIFDAAFFSERLAAILFSTFAVMLAIIAGSMVLLLLLVSLNPTLTVLTMLPPAFAYICTLGTLKLIGHPLDIPALMLSIVILGMGIDYAIFCVRAHQRYRVVSHPTYVQVRSSVFLAGTSTLIGFGVLSFAEHSLLRSIGITSLLGIAYSLLGTFLLLPPLLKRYFSGNAEQHRTVSADLARRVRSSYRTVEAYPRMFARCKLRFDPMFTDLPRMLGLRKEIRAIMDVGCGYGIPACWCLEKYTEARVAAIDPDPERVRVAALAFGSRGTAMLGWAPELPPLEDGTVDVALLLDMLHYLDDRTAAALVRRCFQKLAPGGILVTRCTIPAGKRPSWLWRLEDARIRASGRRARYRSPGETAGLLQEAGFSIVVNEVSANPELAWLVGRAEKR